MATPTTIRGSDARKGIRVTAAAGEVVSALSIALNDSNPNAVWAFTVEARCIDGGLMHVGRMLSIPPSISRRRGRVLAIAFVPGCIEWVVTPELVDVVVVGDATRASNSVIAAELTLAADASPAGAGPALLASPGLATLTPQAAPVYESTGYANSGVISAVPCAIGPGIGWISGYGGTSLAAPAWVFLFDLADLPADGTPAAIQPIRLRAGQSFALDSPRLFQNGLVWVESTSESLVATSPTSDLWVSAVVERR